MSEKCAHQEAGNARNTCLALPLQVAADGLHSFPTGLVAGGVPAIISGLQRNVRAAVDHLKNAAEPRRLREFPIDLYMPTFTMNIKPYVFDRRQLSIVCMDVPSFVVCLTSRLRPAPRLIPHLVLWMV